MYQKIYFESAAESWVCEIYENGTLIHKSKNNLSTLHDAEQYAASWKRKHGYKI